MNGWDLFTWICSAALALSAILIFSFFVRDAGDIIRRSDVDSDDTEDE